MFSLLLSHIWIRNYRNKNNGIFRHSIIFKVLALRQIIVASSLKPKRLGYKWSTYVKLYIKETATKINYDSSQHRRVKKKKKCEHEKLEILRLSYSDV